MFEAKIGRQMYLPKRPIVHPSTHSMAILGKTNEIPGRNSLLFALEIVPGMAYDPTAATVGSPLTGLCSIVDSEITIEKILNSLSKFNYV